MKLFVFLMMVLKWILIIIKLHSIDYSKCVTSKKECYFEKSFRTIWKRSSFSTLTKKLWIKYLFDLLLAVKLLFYTPDCVANTVLTPSFSLCVQPRAIACISRINAGIIVLIPDKCITWSLIADVFSSI